MKMFRIPSTSVTGRPAHRLRCDHTKAEGKNWYCPRCLADICDHLMLQHLIGPVRLVERVEVRSEYL
jgi:hypothetical protein